MKKRFDRSGTARRKAVTAIAALTMALVLAVGGAGAATLLSAQPETLTVGAVVPHITAEAPQQTAPADPAPAAESTATAPEQKSSVNSFVINSLGVVEGVNFNVIVREVTTPCSPFFLARMKVYCYGHFILVHDLFHFFIIKGHRTRG